MHSLPLEYRELKIIEIMENHAGIFLRHDMEFFRDPSKPIRVCILFDSMKEFPTQIHINSNFRKRVQGIVRKSTQCMCFLSFY